MLLSKTFHRWRSVLIQILSLVERFLWRKAFWEGFRHYVLPLSEWKRNHLYCAILDKWLASLAVPENTSQKEFVWGIQIHYQSQNYWIILQSYRNQSRPRKTQILSLNVAYFRDKLHLLRNLFFQNTIPFWFSVQPEPHAVIDCLFFYGM